MPVNEVFASAGKRIALFFDFQPLQLGRVHLVPRRADAHGLLAEPIRVTAVEVRIGLLRLQPGDFGLQLRAKQKLKGYYGNMTEKAFRRAYEEAARAKGDTGENLIGLLERRLDAVIYRAKFVPTVFAARQFVNHGHVMVNGQRVTITSYQVKVGDVIEVRERSKQLGIVLESIDLAERDVPDYVEVDHSKMTAKYVRVPVLTDVPYPVQMEPNLVVEFYSR